MMRGLFTASTSIAALLTATASAAQETAPTAPVAPVAPAATTGSTSYDAAFFAQYSPRTALDIANRVPGFQLQESNNDVRGFAGAAGNVVLNGARPSSKSESLQTILSQIPAARVVRVEVGPGTLYGSDYAGRSQVLNIILSEVGGFDGTINATLGKQWTGPVNPNISASATIKRGQHGFSFSAGTDNEDRWDEGTDIITDPATGERFEKRRKLNHYRPRNPYVSAGWSLEQAADRSIHLNGRFQKFTEDFIQTNRVYPTGEEPRDDRLFMKLDSPGYELSGDITRPLAGGALKLVALTNRRHREGTDTVEVRDDGVAVDGFEQSTESQQNETLGKLSWTRSDLWGLSVEAGAEAALNTLDYHLDLFDITPAGKVRIDLPLDDATVREKRAEFYVKAGKQFSPKLRVDAGINYEMSDLKVAGDTQAERQLKFLKPSLTVDLKPGSDWHAQFIVRRTVAQLNFFDFISAAELSNSRINGGNANLQPQRVWEYRATLDRPILGTGLIKLDVGHDQIDMLQDRILICDPDDPTDPEKCLDAPGNLGAARRTFASLTVDAPLDMLWKGLRAKAFGQIQRTKVEDPISGETRRFSNFFPEWQWELELRRDIGKWAYGTTLSDRDRFSFFRGSEVDTNWNDGVFGSAFVEYRPSPKTTVSLNVENIFDTRSMRQREFTFPNRGFPGPSLNEFRERNNHPIVTLGFKRTFGGAAAKAN